jgi:hypothetical protein
MVEEVLAKDEYARNNDFWLMLGVWKKQGVRIAIDGPIDKIISPETIRRVRQKIQNDERMFIPTDPQVIKKRRQREISMKVVINHI